MKIVRVNGMLWPLAARTPPPLATAHACVRPGMASEVAHGTLSTATVRLHPRHHRGDMAGRAGETLGRGLC